MILCCCSEHQPREAPDLAWARVWARAAEGGSVEAGLTGSAEAEKGSRAEAEEGSRAAVAVDTGCKCAQGSRSWYE